MTVGVHKINVPSKQTKSFPAAKPSLFEDGAPSLARWDRYNLSTSELGGQILFVGQGFAARNGCFLSMTMLCSTLKAIS